MTQSDLKQCVTPSIEQLVSEIVAINQAWKAATELCQPSSSLANSLRDLKLRLQIRLLQHYAPDRVYLQLDTDTESSELLYSVRLREAIGTRWNAEHIPKRLVKKHQLEQFIYSH